MADLTTQILIDIRDAVRATNERIDQTNQRLDQTNQRLDQTIERLDRSIDRLDRLERRQVDGEIRIGTEIVAIAGAIRNFHDDYLAERPSRAILQDHERRLRALETPGV
jgi:predicted RNase H-like nuclease (RuvC/YqgF family)